LKATYRFGGARAVLLDLFIFVLSDRRWLNQTEEKMAEGTVIKKTKVKTMKAVVILVSFWREKFSAADPQSMRHSAEDASRL